MRRSCEAGVLLREGRLVREGRASRLFREGRLPGEGREFRQFRERADPPVRSHHFRDERINIGACLSLRPQKLYGGGSGGFGELGAGWSRQEAVMVEMSGVERVVREPLR